MTSMKYENIRCNLEIIREKIEKAKSKRKTNKNEITIVAVTKTADIDDIQTVYGMGIQHFGENRVELLSEKAKQLSNEIQWHMIGTIQRRKIPSILDCCKYIDSVDRIEVAETLHKKAMERGITEVPILIQLNISGEDTKHGFRVSDFEDIFDKISSYHTLIIRGLMTIAPLNADEKTLRNIFSKLKDIGDKYKLETLSMGMSDDYEIAIEEGATEIRLGRAIFG
ncbi:MAG TPA: YggS family pyridoxal phosphate-dependent enzyme [Candidatus Hydrogenedens sp.]|nr:YggS family pyridoxal phosphate-dependent enzyme [Candidatus Hydrogenedens sp.]HOL20980.1 YggS family pyridoxal phosphate-dependent enzyme [Candidatus Hydrogenedens sp.]